MKWDEPISKPNSTVTVHMIMGATTWSFQFNQPYMPDQIKSRLEFVSEVLDSRVRIDDAGIGRRIYEGTLMDLALQRLRAAGLIPATTGAPIVDTADFQSVVPEAGDGQS